MGVSMSLQYLRHNSEITIWKQIFVERRIRRVKNLYQVYDINWRYQKCDHVAYCLNDSAALHSARSAPSKFLSKGLPLVQNFARSRKRDQLTKSHNRLCRLLENRLFYKNAKLRRTQFIIIEGGKSLTA
jgi:hypothetical protein